MPDGGLPMLLQDVAALPTGSRPFTRGAQLVAYGKENASLEELKPLRKTEQFWRGRVNVRSDPVERSPRRSTVYGRQSHTPG